MCARRHKCAGERTGGGAGRTTPSWFPLFRGRRAHTLFSVTALLDPICLNISTVAVVSSVGVRVSRPRVQLQLRAVRHRAPTLSTLRKGALGVPSFLPSSSSSSSLNGRAWPRSRSARCRSPGQTSLLILRCACGRARPQGGSASSTSRRSSPFRPFPGRRHPRRSSCRGSSSSGSSGGGGSTSRCGGVAGGGGRGDNPRRPPPL